MATLAEQVLQQRDALRAQAAQQALADQQALAQQRAAEAAEAERNRPRTWGEALFQDLPLQLAGSAVGLGQAAYGAANMASLGLLDYTNPLDMPQNFQETQQILLGAQTPRTQAAVQRVSEGYDRGIGAGLAESADLAYLQNLVAGNAASLLPGAAAARAGSVKAAADALAKGLPAAEARAATQAGGVRALERVVGAQIAGATNVNTINAIREQGGSEEQQWLGGFGGGLAAGLGGIGLMRLTGAGRFEAAAANALPGGAAAGQLNRGVATETLAGLAREGTEESLQSATEQLSQNLFTPNVSLGQGVGEAFGTGLVAGGLLGGGMGATMAMSSPRTNDATPLGRLIRDKFAQLNNRSGAPVAPSAVSDAPAPETPPTMEVEELPLEDISPLPAADVSLDSGPAGGIENIDLADTPLPRRPLVTLNDLMGRRPQPAPPTPPLADVEELPASAYQRPGLLGLLDAQRGRGNVEAGYDLLGGALPAEGAFPQAAGVEAAAAPSTAVPNTQGRLDFETAPTLKKTMTQLLGVKPAALRGKAWADFEAAAAKAGVGPTSPELEPFLRQYTQTLTDSDTAFAGRMAEKYGAPAEAEAPTPAPTQPTPAPAPMSVPEPDPVVPAQDTAPLPKVTGSKQVRGDFTDGGTYHEVSLDDGRTVPIQRQRGDGGIQLSGWYAGDTYLGETKAEALRALPAVVGPSAPTPAQIEHAEEVVEAAASVGQPTEGVTPGTTEPAAEPPQDQALMRDLTRTIKQAMNDDPTESHESAATFAINELLMEAPGIEELNQYFMAAKALPIYKDLPADMRKDIDDNFEQLHARFDGGHEGPYDPMKASGRVRFDRAEGGSPKTHMPLEQFEALVERANQMLGQSHPSQRTVVGVETVADFEMMTGQAAPSDARGAFVNGKTYLILENIADKKDFGFVLAHERGHQGLAALLGDRLPAVVNRLWTNPATRKRIQAKMRTMDARSTEENGSLRRLAGEEVLADMLAGGEKLNGDVLSKLRSALDNAFTAFIGASDMQMSNAEVDALLRDVAAVMRGASPAAIREGDPKHLQGLQFAMADPAELTTGDPRFSRAEADMEEILAAASAEQTSKRTIGDVGIEAASAAWDKMRNLQGATVGHRILDVALNATPLNQMANAYDKLFDGKLKAFARLKRRKEAESNKALTAERELVYRGAGKDQQVKTSPVGLAKQWAKFKSRSPAQATALDWLNRESTLYRLWPEKSWDQQSKLDYNETGFTEAERRAAYNEVSRLWKATGPQGQAIFRASQAIYSRMWGERFEALAAEISRATGVARFDANGKPTKAFWEAHGRRIDSAVHKLRTGPYSPLQRYGDFLVTVRDQQGRVVWFSGHDSIEEANRVSAQLKAGDFAGGQYRVTGATLRRDQDWQGAGFNQAEVHALENIAETVNVGDPAATKHLREEIRRALVETYLQSLPQSAFLSHANRRKNTKGATLDSFRAFNDYTVKASHSIASLKHDGEISSLLTGLQQVATEAAADPNAENVLRRQQVVEAVKAQHTASLEVEQNKVANALSQAGFFMFMSSPSQLFINSMQTFMVTLPRMVAAYGNSSGIKAVQSALAKFARSRGNLLGENTVLDKNGPVYQILQELHERGTLDFTLAMDMMGYARGDSSALSGHWRSMLEVAGWAMQKSEVFNRQVAAVAAAELEVQKRNLTGPLNPDQLKELADIADDMVLTTQFDFSQSNKPPIMQGPWRKVILQFQTYRLNMLAMMAKDIRDSFSGTKEEKESARRALAWMLGTQLALTGVAGTVLAPLVFGIADAFRDDDDLLDSETEFVRAVPQILAHGLLAGVVDTRRVGANQLIQPGGAGYAPTDASAKETFQYYALANLGPWAGLGANIFDGIEKALGGDHVGAMKGLAPAGIRDVYRAYFEGTEGVKDSRQIAHYEPGVWDTAMTVVGLRSGDRREHEEKRGAAFEASSTAYKLKDRYLGRLALGYSLNDQDMINQAEADLAAFQERYPDLVGKRDRAGAIIRRVRTEQNAAETGIATARPIADSIRQQIGL